MTYIYSSLIIWILTNKPLLFFFLFRYEELISFLQLSARKGNIIEALAAMDLIVKSNNIPAILERDETLLTQIVQLTSYLTISPHFVDAIKVG